MITIAEFEQLPPNQRHAFFKDFDLGDLHNALVNDTRLNPWRDTAGRIRPSTIGSGSNKVGLFEMGCPRQMWFQFLGYKTDPLVGDDKKRVDVGSATHALIQSYLEAGAKQNIISARVEEWVEGQLTDDYRSLVRGRVDAIIYVGTQPVVVEYKSVTQKALATITGPRDYHITQPHIYMKLLDIPYGVVAYVTITEDMKWRLKTFSFVWNPTRWRAIETQITQVFDHLDNGTVPPRGNKPYFCQHWCPYREYCDELEEVIH